jgi:hypothetical protein
MGLTAAYPLRVEINRIQEVFSLSTTGTVALPQKYFT